MINNCVCCNKSPKEAGFISCENIKCSEYGVEYFVYHWQNLVKPGVDEQIIDAPNSVTLNVLRN